MYGNIHRIHFVGIGGIGMSGIAEVLLNLGYGVSGSDLKASDITQRLASLGGDIREGHRAENVQGADVVVISSAVKADNPEVVEAHRLHIPVIPRAEMLAELMRLKYGIAIAGTHGKTTTTSMVATALVHGGIDPTAVIGGRLDAFGSNAKLGQGRFLVAEADESDGSFLKLTPTIAVVTNIDADHLDFYRDLDQIKEVFVDFINKIPFYGVAVLCLDDKGVQDILPLVNKRFVTYGFGPQADYVASEVEHLGDRTRFIVHHRGERLGELSFRMPGRHNVLNALAALAVARELEVPFTAVAEALAEFGGPGRRFQRRFDDDVMVVDDYGHHPTEVQATLAAARAGWDRRLIVVFQPHRYSRTESLFGDFATAFNQADRLIVTDVYAAGEAPRPGVSGADLAEAVRNHGHRDVRHIGELAAVAEHLRQTVEPGDIIITLGAGNVWQAGEAFIRLWRERSKA